MAIGASLAPSAGGRCRSLTVEPLFLSLAHRTGDVLSFRLTCSSPLPRRLEPSGTAISGRWLTTLRVILPGPKESISPRWSTQLPELFWRRLGQTGPSHESQNQRGDHALIMTRSNRHCLDA